MQETIKTNLQLTIAKLELKQLELIDKLSINNNDNDYIIHCITSPITNRIISVNGDWESVIGESEVDSVGRSIFNYAPEYEVNDIMSRQSDRLVVNQVFNNKEYEFESFFCDVITTDGTVKSVSWKSKYFPELNATVSIGRVKK